MTPHDTTEQVYWVEGLTSEGTWQPLFGPAPRAIARTTLSRVIDANDSTLRTNGAADYDDFRLSEPQAGAKPSKRSRTATERITPTAPPSPPVSEAPAAVRNGHKPPKRRPKSSNEDIVVRVPKRKKG